MITIAVISYNSQNTILDTLESIYNQSYEKMDLIISDDSSNDDTLKIVQNWILNKKDRFNRVKIVTSEINTGVTANSNRALANCETKYIKLIAGDDILEPNAIHEFVKFIEKKDYLPCVVFGKLMDFHADYLVYNTEKKSLDIKTEPSKQTTKVKNMVHSKKKAERLKNLAIIAPATFFKVDFLKEMGNFNESYPFLEDTPFFVKCIMKNISFYYCEKIVVFYRHGSNNLCSNSKKDRYININYYYSRKKFFFDILIKCYKNEHMYMTAIIETLKILRSQIIIKFGKNKRGIIYKIVTPNLYKTNK